MGDKEVTFDYLTLSKLMTVELCPCDIDNRPQITNLDEMIYEKKVGWDRVSGKVCRISDDDKKMFGVYYDVTIYEYGLILDTIET